MGGAASHQQLPPRAPWEDDDARSVALRQAVFESFIRVHPDVPFYWANHANFLYHWRAGGVEAARPVYRAAVTRCADYDCVYAFWVAMEEDHWDQTNASDGAGGEPPHVVRELFEEWRARSEADAAGGGSEQGKELLWIRYIHFEIEHGGAKSTRAVAAAAAAACPRNAWVRAECVMAEVRLGDDERARAAFDRTLADLAGDDEATKRLTEKVRRGGASLSEEWFGGGCLSSFCRGWWFRPHRWWEQI